MAPPGAMYLQEKVWETTWVTPVDDLEKTLDFIC